ncbi:DUF551 domain-containing protein [Edwardsiella ictaluri]|uniref:DUF551 domain-containing protein n=1 Tax=Edwardsiella ictaluri TaxID=67780 RepID=UPI0018DDCCBA|nr:DUF551 domain-containing protein [Edwardsiella ictaluri]QPW26472.1 DUF551 domain-containing protein [Edwardsiella ictaluri]
MNMREEFEKWVLSDYNLCGSDRAFLDKDISGEYVWPAIRIAWKLWQAAQPKWIKCSEQMPPENVLVVIADQNSYGVYGSAVATRRAGYFHPAEGLKASNYDGGAIVEIDMEVTHWMPLPNPPEE